MPILSELWQGVKQRFSLHDHDSQWQKHGYSKSRLYWKGKPTKYSAIFKNGELVFIPSKRYQLLPHEIVIETAEKLIDEEVLKPFFGITPKEAMYANGVEAQAYIYQGYGLFLNPIPGIPGWGKQLYLNFRYKERQVNGQKVFIGASIYNSVDGTLRLGVRSFVYFPQTRTTIFFKNINSDNLLATYSGKHLGSLESDKEKLANLVKIVMRGADMLLPVFRKWKEEKLDTTTANEVLKRIPAKYVAPFVESIEDKNGMFQARLDNNNPISLWDFYQGVSEGIWHGERAKFQTRLLLYDKLHEALMSRQFFDVLVSE